MGGRTSKSSAADVKGALCDRHNGGERVGSVGELKDSRGVTRADGSAQRRGSEVDPQGGHRNAPPKPMGMGCDGE